MASIYNIELFASRCAFEVTVNGLLLFRKNAPAGCSMTCPINTELVEKDNIVTISLLPTIIENGQLSRPEDIDISGTIKRYEAGDITGPEFGELIASIDFTDVVARSQIDSFTITDPAKLFPLTKQFVFDNEEISFRDRLLNAPVIKDEALVLSYAEHLRELLERQDLESLFLEYKPKLDDYAIAYPLQFPDPKKWFVDFFRDDFFPGGPITEFKREDIGLKAWCDGRIWEIFVKPAQKYFKNKGLDGDTNSVEVYVGMVDGKLRIVR